MYSESQHFVDDRTFSRNRRPENLPSTEALKTLRKYIVTNISKIVETHYVVWDDHIFIKLRRMIIARLIIFNGRRSEEVSRLLVEEYNDMVKKTWINEKSTLAFEQDTCVHNMSWEPGKGNKMVPLLVPDDCMDGLALLADESVRLLCNVLPTNPYIFPVTNSVDKHVSATSDLLIVKKAAGIDIYEVSSIKMWHLTANRLKGMHISEEARCIHLGHEKFTHNAVYVSPQTNLLIENVGTALSVIDCRLGEQKDKYKHDGNGSASDLLCEETSKESSKRKRFIIRPEERREDILDKIVNEADRVQILASNSSSDEEQAKRMPVRKRLRKRKEWQEGKSSESETENIVQIRSIEKNKGRKERAIWDFEQLQLLHKKFDWYMNNKNTLDATGNLPSKKEIMEFLQDNDSKIMPDFSPQTKYIKTRTKIFNERQKIRATLQKKLSFISDNK